MRTETLKCKRVGVRDGRFAAQVSPRWDPLTSSEQSETEQIENKFSRACRSLMYVLENKPCETTCHNRFAMPMNFKELSEAFLNGYFFLKPISLSSVFITDMSQSYWKRPHFHDNCIFRLCKIKGSQFTKLQQFFFCLHPLAFKISCIKRQVRFASVPHIHKFITQS